MSLIFEADGILIIISLFFFTICLSAEFCCYNVNIFDYWIDNDHVLCIAWSPLLFQCPHALVTLLSEVFSQLTHCAFFWLLTAN